MIHPCIWCMQPFEPGEKVRSIHPFDGLLHPQYHIYPDGGMRDGTPIPEACSKCHTDEHVHEMCAESYCKQVGLRFASGTLALESSLSDVGED